MIMIDKVVTKQVEKGTIGGPTYWIESEDWPGELRALCFRKIRSKGEGKGRCSSAAGYGTDHYGEGACKYHGGTTTDAIPKNIKTGRRATQTRKMLADRIDAYVEGADAQNLYDLTYELAAMRVIFRETIDMFPEPGTDEYKREFNIYARRIQEMIQATGSLVDKISRIESRNTLTAAQIVYLRARIADLFVKYIEDPGRREQAVAELAQSIPGGNNDADILVKALPG